MNDENNLIQQKNTNAQELTTTQPIQETTIVTETQNITPTPTIVPPTQEMTNILGIPSIQANEEILTPPVVIESQEQQIQQPITANITQQVTEENSLHLTQNTLNNNLNENTPTPTINPNNDICIPGTIEKTNKKNNKRTYILLIILIAMIIIFWPKINKALINAGLIKENNNTISTTPSDDNNSSNNENEQISTTWNGIYKNGNNQIKIYQTSNSEIIYSFEGESFSNGTAEIKNNQAINDSFDDKTTITLNKNDLTITSTSKYIVSGKYTKNGTYTKNEYYEDTVGEIKYATSNINGIFKNNDITIKIFQTKSDEGRITITKKYSTYSKSFDIVNEKIYLEDDFFDELEKIDAEINGSTLTITASDTDPDGLLNEISGTYTKTSSYSIDEIIKDNSW